MLLSKPLIHLCFARNIVVKKDEMIPIPIKESLEK